MASAQYELNRSPTESDRACVDWGFIVADVVGVAVAETAVGVATPAPNISGGQQGTGMPRSSNNRWCTAETVEAVADLTIAGEIAVEVESTGLTDRAAAVDVGLVAGRGYLRNTIVTSAGRASGGGWAAIAALTIGVGEAALADAATGTHAAATVGVRFGAVEDSVVTTGGLAAELNGGVGAGGGDLIAANGAGAIGGELAVITRSARPAGTAAVRISLVGVGVPDAIGAAGHLARHIADARGAVVTDVTRVTIDAAIRARTTTVSVGLVLIPHAVGAGRLKADAGDAIQRLAVVVTDTNLVGSAWRAVVTTAVRVGL